VADQYNWLLRVEEFWSMSQHGGPHHYGNEDANFKTRPDYVRPVGDPIRLEADVANLAYTITVEEIDGRHIVQYNVPE
jgi:hypothetical protein